MGEFGVPSREEEAAREMHKKFEKEYPYEKNIMSHNTRCELAEGVAFDRDLDLPMDSETRQTIGNLIHEYVQHIFGDPTHD